MGHEGTTAQHPGTATRAPGVAGRRGLVLVLLRLAAARVPATPLAAPDWRLPGGLALLIAWLLSMVLTAAGLPVLTGWN